jgi:glyoxylase-like metal-dependent hydrolase (beta-lactamase superfamily II)
MMKAALLLAMLAAAIAPQAVSAGDAGAVRPLAPGVWLLPGAFESGRQPDGNTVIWSGEAHAPRPGLVVLDTGLHAAHSQAILDFAERQRMPILAVVNSHWHLDHISGNARLRSHHPQLTVYASNAIEGALRGFLARSRRDSLAYLEKAGDSPQSEDVRGDVATIDSGPALLPVVVCWPRGTSLRCRRHSSIRPARRAGGRRWRACRVCPSNGWCPGMESR